MQKLAAGQDIDVMPLPVGSTGTGLLQDAGDAAGAGDVVGVEYAVGAGDIVGAREVPGTTKAADPEKMRAA